MKSPAFSLVIPAYNESLRLARTLPEMIDYLGRTFAPGQWEIVVVDDGSTDDTAEVARSLLAGIEGQVVSYRPNGGKGKAIVKGMLTARGEVRLFSDADLSTPLSEIPRFMAAHRQGAPVVIGSRKRPGARVEVRQPLVRESMGKVFTFLANLLVLSGVSDFTCGFKSFRDDVCEKIFPRLSIFDWAFDVEMLALVREEGYAIREIPVRWRNDPRTKVDVSRAFLPCLLGLLRLAMRRMGARVS